MVQITLTLGPYKSVDSMALGMSMTDRGALQTLVFPNRMTVQIPEL